MPALVYVGPGVRAAEGRPRRADRPARWSQTEDLQLLTRSVPLAFVATLKPPPRRLSSCRWQGVAAPPSHIVKLCGKAATKALGSSAADQALLKGHSIRQVAIDPRIAVSSVGRLKEQSCTLAWPAVLSQRRAPVSSARCF
jgi:hypothetical protein